jgi:hypothetical protein
MSATKLGPHIHVALTNSYYCNDKFDRHLSTLVLSLVREQDYSYKCLIGSKAFSLCISFGGFGVEESGISLIVVGEILHIRRDWRIIESGKRDEQPDSVAMQNNLAHVKDMSNDSYHEKHRWNFISIHIKET